jgi:hypothetical protein
VRRRLAQAPLHWKADRAAVDRNPPRLSCPPVDRNTVLWAMVVFFGASLMFSTIRDASDEDGIGISLAAQVAAGLLLVAFIVLIVKRRG